MYIMRHSLNFVLANPAAKGEAETREDDVR